MNRLGAKSSYFLLCEDAKDLLSSRDAGCYICILIWDKLQSLWDADPNLAAVLDAEMERKCEDINQVLASARAY